MGFVLCSWISFGFVLHCWALFLYPWASFSLHLGFVLAFVILHLNFKKTFKKKKPLIIECVDCWRNDFCVTDFKCFDSFDPFVIFFYSIEIKMTQTCLILNIIIIFLKNNLSNWHYMISSLWAAWIQIYYSHVLI